MANQPNAGAVSAAYPFYGNKYIQFGSTAFTTTESDKSIVTSLTNIEMGLVSYDDTMAIATATDDACNSLLAVEREINSGAFLVVRSTQDAANHSAATFSYFLIGNVDSTD